MSKSRSYPGPKRGRARRRARKPVGKPVLVQPREAALILQQDFQRIACKFCPRDRAMREDLAQEMTLAVLLCERPANLSYLRGLGAWRARDYLLRYGGLVLENRSELPAALRSRAGLAAALCELLDLDE